MKNIFWQKIKQNWKSGLTVSLVSIPLSVSLAVASQSTPLAGIITAVWAGLIASIFAGSNYNIVGPTGALSGIIAAYALVHGAGLLSMLAIVAGGFILIAYGLRLERYLVFVPASTIIGFTLGVAFIIAFNQFNFALGLNNLPKHEKFIENLIESFHHVNEASPVTLAVFVVFLVALFVLLKITPRLPGAITLAPLGIALGYLSETGTIPWAIQTLGSKFPDMSSAIWSKPLFMWDNSLLVAGATVAFIAILETMLSAKIADGMSGTKHDKRKEMLGLGLANIASGLAGGIAATAALARTSLNVKTGATDKISATISSVVIALISLLFLVYFKYIPLAAIAAILVFVAIRMVEAEHLERMFRVDKRSFLLALFVGGVTVVEDPVVGILLGTAIALVLFVEKLSKGQFELVVNDENKKIVSHVSGEELEAFTKNSDTIVYSIKGQLAYINAQAHIARFEKDLNGYRQVVIRLRELYFIDLDGVDALEEIVGLIQKQGKGVLITGVNPLIATMLQESLVYKKLSSQGKVFMRTSEALATLGYNLQPNYSLKRMK